MTSFLDLHGRPGRPLLLPNPWDLGSARLLASLGFEALATTSSGFAASLGRLDYRVTRDEALAHAGGGRRAGLRRPRAGVGRRAGAGGRDRPARRGAGLAGGSIEDATGREGDPIFPRDLAAERIAAAAGAVRAAGMPFVLTARAENHLHGRDDLADTIARLQAFEAAGADVLYAPGLTRLEDIREVVRSVGKPVNVLAHRPRRPSRSSRRPV
jgi:2-methylisocitrate lyase-like PEP mutase family enzyme